MAYATRHAGAGHTIHPRDGPQHTRIQHGAFKREVQAAHAADKKYQQRVRGSERGREGEHMGLWSDAGGRLIEIE